MKLLGLASVLVAAATADAAGIYNGAKVGDWTPPNPPAKEIAHLAHRVAKLRRFDVVCSQIEERLFLGSNTVRAGSACRAAAL